MSTYSTDPDLLEEPDEYQTYVFVSSSSIEGRVRLDMSIATDMDQEYFMTPDYARQMAAALIRAAVRAET